MRTYRCICKQVIYFDNSQCLRCGHELGFCPECRNLVALETLPEGHFRCGNTACGAELVKCPNYLQYQVCNRCVSAVAEGTLCDCCRFNATIPDLAVSGNLERWGELERAKRRLFYDLDYLRLPYGMATDGVDPPLSFDFKADEIPAGDFWRSVNTAQQIYTGHADGRITINIRETDAVEREKLRIDMGEAHRTLIGHFRHEVGHYYWDVLVKNRREEECIAVFGDHNQPTYAEALERHYREGAPANWAESYLSAYATMHPWEDFAETWATFLDMASTLDTAYHLGFGGTNDAVNADCDAMIVRYQQLGLALNEINRSQGLLDVVPEVFVEPVNAKLRFVHALVRAGRAENPVFQVVSAVHG